MHKIFKIPRKLLAQVLRGIDSMMYTGDEAYMRGCKNGWSNIMQHPVNNKKRNKYQTWAMKYSRKPAQSSILATGFLVPLARIL
jgi:hypothetical protein